ncbi:MAG: putative cytosine deaminase [Actinomycetota bacterium]
MTHGDLVVRSAQLSDATFVDIGIKDGRIIEVSQAPAYTYAEELDARGFCVLPSFVEPHAHLDKAFLADRVHNPAGDLMGAIEGLANVRHTLTPADTIERATRAATLMSRNGVTAIRTHADTTLVGGLESVLALLEVKKRCAHFIDIQVAALMEWPLTGVEGASRRSLARDAIDAGVDVIGGCPHLDPDPKEAVEFLVQTAVSAGIPLDLHADENLRPTSVDLEHVAHVVLAQGIQHRIAASHCVSLSTRDEHDIQRIADMVAKAGISVIALPQTNLYLQARGVQSNSPRAITPIHALRRAGVNVAAGADNLQDPFNLVGRADPLEIASLLMTASHLSTAEAIESVTTNSSLIVTGENQLLTVGSAANLVGIRSTTVREAIAMGPPDRFVVYGGVVISEQKRNRK